MTAGRLASTTVLLALLTSCTGGSTLQPRPATTTPATVAMRYLAISGTHADFAAGQGAEFRWHELVRQGVADWAVVSPDTVSFRGTGCGDFLHAAPVRLIHVDDERLSWVLHPVGGSDGDCDQSHLGLIRFSAPVFDMQHRVRARFLFVHGAWIGKQRHVETVMLRPVADVPQRLLRPGPMPDWGGYDPGAPRCMWDRKATDVTPCEETRP